jgi:hypothetical protein
MVNHVRNLLLNESGEFLPVGNVLEEYVPAEFVAKKLTGYLVSIDKVLFPEADRNIKLQRIMSYLSLLHSTFEEDVLAYDPRITYSFNKLYDLPHIDLALTFKELNSLQQISSQLFEGLPTEKEYFDHGTSVDRLCSVLLAFVSKLDQL